MKKLISIVLTILLLTGQIVSVSANADKEAYFDVVSLGILKGDENGDLHLEDELTRAELAAILTRLLRYEDVAAAFKDVAMLYNDVKEDDWFAGYVGAMYVTGLMRGVGDNTFDPYSAVSYEQAMKAVVVALGYATAAEKKGGYPTGYMAEGARLKLGDDIKSVKPFTRESLMILLYNALDVDMLVEQYGGEETHKIEQGKTLRNQFLYHDREKVLMKEEGIVTANNDTYLTAPNSTLEYDEVEIEDVIFKAGTTNAYDLIGQRVEYYAVEDEAGIKTLISIRAARTNEVTEIDAKEVTKATRTEVIYKKDGTSSRTEDISSAIILKNGRRILLPTDADIGTKRGSIRMIDNDEDSDIDVVFVTDWEIARVKAVYDNTIEFEAGTLFDGSKFLHIDTDGDKDNPHYIIKNSDGEAILPEQIEVGSILSISSDRDRKFYTIITSKNVVEGTVNSIGEAEIELDGEVIPICEGDVLDFEAGDEIIAYLDFKGIFAAFEEQEKTQSYAYILAAASKGAIGNNIQVKMVVGSLVDFQYDKNEEDLDDTNLIPTVICKNSGVEIFDVADRVIVDGVAKKTANEKVEALTEGLYLYELNADGEVKKLTTAQSAGGGTNMTYNPYDKTFAKNSRRTPFAINENTVVICLPTNGDAEDDDYFVPLKIKNSGSSTFTATGYDFDTDTKKVKALIFMEKMKKTDALTATESSSVGMVAKSIMTMDDDGNFVPKIIIATKNGLAEYMVNEVPGQNDVLNTLRVGDLINYEVDLSGMLSNARIIRSFAGGGSAFDDLTEVYGNITDVSFDEIHLASGNLVATVTADTARGISTVDITQRNVPPIFIYDSEQKTVEIGAISDIYPRGSEIFYALKPAENQGVAKVCVICR